MSQRTVTVPKGFSHITAGRLCTELREKVKGPPLALVRTTGSASEPAHQAGKHLPHSCTGHRSLTDSRPVVRFRSYSFPRVEHVRNAGKLLQHRVRRSRTGSTTPILTVPNDATGLNQLGISGDGDKLMLTNAANIFEYTASTETWETTPRSGPTVANQMGGVDPLTGLFYFGGRIGTTGSTFSFKSYDPTTNALSSGVVTVDAVDAPGGNGDLAFDSRGNLYFVSSNTTMAQVYRVNGSQFGSGSTIAATKVGPTIATGVALNSMAFADDGYLYVGGSGENGFLRVNPITGAVLERRTLSVAITDLGTNAVPFTGAISIDVPNGRVNPDDQFTVTIGGGGIMTGNTATTSGSETSKTVGPILILPGDTYTIEQTPAGTTRPGDYDTSWVCIDPATGNTVASGPGSTGQFTIPAGVKDVACSFTSTPKPVVATVAENDESLDNTQGQPVTVDVIGNDRGDLDPTSVRILDADGTPVTELVVPGQGIWTVNTSTGAITFTPEANYSGNPTPIRYTVADTRGNTTTANVTVTYKILPPATVPPAAPSPSPSDVVLALTGSNPFWLAIAGLGMALAGGALFMLRGRRRQQSR